MKIEDSKHNKIVEPEKNENLIFILLIIFSVVMLLITVTRLINKKEELVITDTVEYITEKNNDLINNINKLTFEIHNNTVKNSSNSNIVQSPYSISMALSVVDNFADGNTKEEIENVLGINDLTNWNNQVAELIKLENEETDYFKLKTSNSLWISNEFKGFADNYKDITTDLNKNYNCSTHILPFKDEDTQRQVDNWIYDNTNGLVNSLGAEIKDYESLIVNTVYFKGTWSNEFKKSNTEKKKFRNKLEEKEVDTMHLYTEELRYLKDSQLEIISLPYYNNYEMLIILSSNKKELSTDKFNSLDTNSKIELLNKFDENAKFINFKTVQIPKFKIEFDNNNIKNELTKLGLQSMFSPDEANLSKLSPYLYISDVKHKTVIDVDEQGTEAASMTAMMMTCMMALQEKEPTKEFIADKPFTFIIRNKENGLIYFIGELNNIN